MNKLTYHRNRFSEQELLERIHNQTLHVPDEELDDFTNQLMEIYYNRDLELNDGK